MSLLNLGLPKWPQMYTTGKPISVDQAKEIIRRTDTFLVDGNGGNDHAWNKRVAERLKMPHLWSFDLHSKKIDWQHRERISSIWRERWQTISSAYVFNDWLSSCYVGGPHGWCNPDGTICFTDNVGKWPSIEEIVEDWKRIANEFRFLDMAATLMDDEHCSEHSPVVSIVVRNGDVALVDPKLHNAHERHEIPTLGLTFEERLDRAVTLSAEQREHGVPESWIDEWAALADKLFPDW